MLEIEQALPLRFEESKKGNMSDSLPCGCCFSKGVNKNRAVLQRGLPRGVKETHFKENACFFFVVAGGFFFQCLC